MRPRRASAAGRADQGFTLIEMMIVMALIVLISVLALPNLSAVFRLSLSASTREIASLLREAYNSAIITKRVYRMAWDLKNNQFWVEAGPDTVLLDSKEARDLRDQRGGDGVTTGGQFQQDKTVSRKKSELPQGVRFEDVVTEQAKEPIVEGMAYSHVFPHGFTEQTVVHLRDSQDHQLSLVLLPLGGKLKMVDEYLSPEDAFGE
ncbi:MAG: prepilin-type N-terminal cleavage/methylation domain-containing protein [Bdellovibrionales bacterium]|nr:prepilin-type N-terminal cleavage/methylation domain-containing protein [Bdellovibrionales bacterium]